jgi:hypothetical protein
METGMLSTNSAARLGRPPTSAVDLNVVHLVADNGLTRQLAYAICNVVVDQGQRYGRCAHLIVSALLARDIIADWQRHRRPAPGHRATWSR